MCPSRAWRERACSLPCSGRLAVSTGSACTSALQEPSYVLRALGRGDGLSESSLRFGLGRITSEQDIDTAISGRDASGVAPAADQRRMKYSELTLRYFESAPACGVLGALTHFAAPPAAETAGPGCNSTCR